MQKFPPLLTILIIIGLLVPGCDSTPSVPLPTQSPHLDEDPIWITVQVLHVRVHETTDLDGEDEFRFFMVGGAEDPTYSAGFVFPAQHSVGVSPGDQVHMSSYGLSVDEKAIGDRLYVYFVGVDADQQDVVVNQAAGVILAGIAEVLAFVVAGGNPAASVITSILLGNLWKYVQQDDVIDDGLITLRRSENWRAGEEDQWKPARNGNMTVKYRVTRTVTEGPKRTPVPKSTPAAKSSCKDVPSLGLGTGQQAIVMIDRLNVRTWPNVPDDWNANVVTSLPVGARVEIIDGPRCAYGGRWWRIRTEDRKTGWVREGAGTQPYLSQSRRRQP